MSDKMKDPMTPLEQRLTAAEKQIQDLKAENARLAERIRILEKAVLPETDFYKAMREAAKGNRGPIKEYYRRGGTTPGFERKKESPAPNGSTIK